MGKKWEMTWSNIYASPATLPEVSRYFLMPIPGSPCSRRPGIPGLQNPLLSGPRAAICQAKALPAYHDCWLQMSPSLSPRSQQADREHCLACVRFRVQGLKGTVVPWQHGVLGGALGQQGGPPTVPHLL